MRRDGRPKLRRARSFCSRNSQDQDHAAFAAEGTGATTSSTEESTVEALRNAYLKTPKRRHSFTLKQSDGPHMFDVLRAYYNAAECDNPALVSDKALLKVPLQS